MARTAHNRSGAVRLAFAAKGAGGVALVTDAVAVAPGTPVPPRLADGTLAGSVLTMADALSNVVAVEAAGLRRAVEAASTTPAGLLGLADRGAIEPGRRADLVALAPRPGGGWRVASVWVGGEAAWPA